MNLIETLVSKATEEACELGKALSKLNFMGIKATDPETGQPLVLDAIKQLNEILACVELLRDRGIAMAGIGDPVAVGEAKGVIVQGMEEAMKAGTLVLSEDDQNPRPEGVNEADNGLPDNGDGGDGDQGNGEGEGEGLGADGTGADDADGSAGGGDGSDGLGDGDGGSDDSDGEEGSGDDTSGDDSGAGDDGGDEEESEEDDLEEEDSSDEEEEEESGSNDV
jgi:hypothetical protein